MASRPIRSTPRYTKSIPKRRRQQHQAVEQEERPVHRDRLNPKQATADQGQAERRSATATLIASRWSTIGRTRRGCRASSRAAITSEPFRTSRTSQKTTLKANSTRP